MSPLPPETPAERDARRMALASGKRAHWRTAARAASPELLAAIEAAKATAAADGRLAQGDALAAEHRRLAKRRPDWPEQWVSSGFVGRCKRWRLTLYMQQLAQLERRELEHTQAFRRFRSTWRAAAPAFGETRAALLTGGSGTGKSLMALWACLQASLAGESWGWVSVARIAEVYARGDWRLVDQLRELRLVVWDEVGDAETMKGHVWATWKELVGDRYADRRDQVLLAIHKLDAAKELLGDEIVDRVTPELIQDAGDGSLRHGVGRC